MNEENQSFGGFTDLDLEAVLRRAIRNTLIIGAISSLVLWKAGGWRNAAMLATGAGISVASIFEWRRLVRFLLAKMEKKAAPRGSVVAVIFFLLRFFVFAAAIYVSLRCFRGSAVALFCGLSLAILVMVWEGIRVLRD